MKSPHIYIVSNKNRTTIYIGVTSNLERRIFEHKAGVGSFFTSNYNLSELVYFEEFGTMVDAIAREKQLKSWKKDWKWDLIKSLNPNLKDLAKDWYEKEDIQAYRVQELNKKNR